MLELYTLDASAGHQFSDLQLGFVPGRGTNMATALANDVISYCTKLGLLYMHFLLTQRVHLMPSLTRFYFIRQWMSSYFWLIGINR